MRSNPDSASIFNLGSILTGILIVGYFYLCYAILFPLHRELPFPGRLIPLFLFFAIPMAIAKFTRHINHTTGIEMANRRIRRIAQSISDGLPIEQEFVLYLRPHWLDGFDGYANPYSRQMLGQWYHRETISFDHILACEIETPFISLGTREMQLSTGSIAVPDTDWKEFAKALMRDAKFIAFIPSNSEGIIWEKNEIEKLGYSSKTVLVQPPEFYQGEWVERHWEDAVSILDKPQEFRQEGIAVPFSAENSKSQNMARRLHDGFSRYASQRGKLMSAALPPLNLQATAADTRANEMACQRKSRYLETCPNCQADVLFITDICPRCIASRNSHSGAAVSRED